MRIFLLFKFLFFLFLVFSYSLLFAQGAVIKDGNWELVVSEEMNTAFSEQLTMLKTMAKTEPSVHAIKAKMERLLNKARQPRLLSLSVEQSEHGVISIFELSDQAIKSTDSKSGSCTYQIEWLEKIIGTVSGTCEDGSIIKGEVSVPNDLEAHYKATITPVDGRPYPVGWDAKWVGS